MIRGVLWAAILSILSSVSARAIDCAQWSRLDDAGRTETINRMIETRLSSGEFEDYTSVRRAAVRRCLTRSMPGIRQDIDGACERGLAAGMEALNRVFEHYVSSCIP
jgi:hypothetical protein